MATLSIMKAAGLRTADNPHSAVPEGAMVKAENCILRYRNVIEFRRGQQFLENIESTVLALPEATNEAAFFEDGMVVHYGDDKLARIRTTDGTDPVAYSGSYEPVDADLLRMKFVEVANNLYFNTSDGLKRLETLDGTPSATGVPTAFGEASHGFDAVLIDTDGWMAGDTVCAYRYVWGIKDSHDNVKLGPPSGNIVVRNRINVTAIARTSNVVSAFTPDAHGLEVGDVVTLLNPDANFGAGPWTLTEVPTSGHFKYAETGADFTGTITYEYGAPRNVQLLPQIPPGITTSHFLQIYRTNETDDADSEPDTEFKLMNEVFPSSAEITARRFSGYIVDRTPSSQLGAPLYTNKNTGDGDEAAKFSAPLGKDMCLFDGRLWLFNTTDKHRFHLRILGTGSPDGLQNNDTITINGVTFTGKTSGTGTNPFQIGYHSASPAQNIETTARSLIDVINAISSTVGVVAFYESTDAAPGKILLEELAIGGAPFAVYASRPSAWGPALTNSPTNAVTSSNDRRAHAGQWSDTDEPEAWPLLNWKPIAPKGVSVLRAIPYRDKMFCMADNGKTYTVSAPWPYRVDELDGSARLIAPDTMRVHANQVFALTDQGVGILTDAGYRIISKPIEDELLQVMALDAALVKRLCFSVTYEADRQYSIWVPTSNEDESAQIGYVYNSLDDTWAKWPIARRWGLVSPLDGKLHMGDAASTHRIRVERKSLNRTDYAEEALPVVISVISETTISLDTVTDVQVGDLLWQSDTIKALITDVDVANKTVDVVYDDGFEVGDAKVLVAIPFSVKFAPLAPQGPDVIKNFRELTVHFREFLCRTFETNYDTETFVVEQTATLKAPAAYGLSDYGSTPYGDPLGLRNRQVEIPANAHKGAMIRVGFAIREAYATFALHGFTLHYEVAEEGGRP